MALKPLRVAIYARVSTADQNPEAQIAELREYARRRELQIVGEYVDHVTGNMERRRTSRTRRDENYTRLMADAARRKFDIVLVWKYDRFARSLQALIEALETFARLKVDFISCTQNVDTTTPMGRLFYHIIGSFAEFERELIAERVRAGIANARAKGKRWGRPRDAALEDEILRLRETGQSLRQIAARVKRSYAGVRRVIERRKECSNRKKPSASSSR
jgi:DNA invertase Pin-like site-specific DNA recombinase